MPRVFCSGGVFVLSARDFHAGVALLAAELAIESLDAVVGIGRGGVPLARALSAELQRPLAVVSARHNASDGLCQQATGTVLVDISGASHLEGGLRLLLCDDICGTGATLQVMSAALHRQLCPQWIRTVTLCRNTGAVEHPGLWIWNTDDWVVFPWEPAPRSAPTRPLPSPESPRRHP